MSGQMLVLLATLLVPYWETNQTRAEVPTDEVAVLRARLDRLEEQNRTLQQQNQDLLARLTQPQLTPEAQRAQAVKMFREAFEAGPTSPAAEGCRTAAGPKDRFVAVVVFENRGAVACLFSIKGKDSR